MTEEEEMKREAQKFLRQAQCYRLMPIPHICLHKKIMQIMGRKLIEMGLSASNFYDLNRKKKLDLEREAIEEIAGEGNVEIRIPLSEMARPALERLDIYKMGVLHTNRKVRMQLSEMERIYAEMSEEDKAFYKEEIEKKRLLYKEIQKS